MILCLERLCSLLQEACLGQYRLLFWEKLRWTQEGQKVISFLVSFQIKLLFHVQLQGTGIWVFKHFSFSSRAFKYACIVNILVFMIIILWGQWNSGIFILFIEVVCQARDELFVIDSSNGFVPNGSTVLVSQGLFVLAGQLFAASVCQSGPAPAFVAPWAY